jgi:electron transport complex protein RnfA
MLSYVSLAISAILVSNVILGQFLGICPFLGVSKNRKQAFGMGVAVIAVVFVSSLITYGIYHIVLNNLEISYMDNVIFILVIAALVQFTEMLVKKFFPSLYKDFGIYLSLITTNCVVLGVTLNNITLGHTFLQMCVYSLAIPVGYLMVIFIFSAIREQLDKAPVPKAFKGVPIALICAAFMALAFTGFAGII